MYMALGGGWELCLGRDFIPAKTMEEIRQRTDWANLLPPDRMPRDLEKEPPTGQAIPSFNKLDFSKVSGFSLQKANLYGYKRL